MGLANSICGPEHRYGGTFSPFFTHFVALIRCLGPPRAYHRESLSSHQQDGLGQGRQASVALGGSDGKLYIYYIGDTGVP